MDDTTREHAILVMLEPPLETHFTPKPLSQSTLLPSIYVEDLDDDYDPSFTWNIFFHNDAVYMISYYHNYNDGYVRLIFWGMGESHDPDKPAIGKTPGWCELWSFYWQDSYDGINGRDFYASELAVEMDIAINNDLDAFLIDRDGWTDAYLRANDVTSDMLYKLQKPPAWMKMLEDLQS